jgi:hypothetical protein
MRPIEHAADLRADAQHREVVRVDERGLDPLRFIGLRQVRAHRPHAADVLEHTRLAQVEKLRNRQPEVARLLRGEVRGDANELFRAAKRQRREDHRVDDREQRRVCADAERER